MPYTARETLAKLKRAGFEEIRQKGSHRFVRHADGRMTFVAMHRREVPIGTFRNILKQAQITEEEFKAL